VESAALMEKSKILPQLLGKLHTYKNTITTIFKILEKAPVHF